MAIRTESKISPKSVGWASEDIKIGLRTVKGAEGLPLFRVLGVANGFKQALDRNNNMTEGLTGQFRAYSFKAPDDIVESGVLYMPSGLHYQIAGALKSAMADDKNAQGKFALDVYARAANNQIGYEYFGQTKVEVDRADVFEDLYKAAGDMPKLSGPTNGDGAGMPASETKADEQPAGETKAPKGGKEGAPA